MILEDLPGYGKNRPGYEGFSKDTKDRPVYKGIEKIIPGPSQDVEGVTKMFIGKSMISLV